MVASHPTLSSVGCPDLMTTVTGGGRDYAVAHGDVRISEDLASHASWFIQCKLCSLVCEFRFSFFLAYSVYFIVLLKSYINTGNKIHYVSTFNIFIFLFICCVKLIFWYLFTTFYVASCHTSQNYVCY